MITTIIFDIGNVLVGFDWEGYLESFGFTDEVTGRISKATVLSPQWDEFDRGAVDDEEIIRCFVKNDPEIEKEIRMICEDIHDMLTIREYAVPWVKELKQKGYRVLYLSNFSRKAEIECAHTLTFLPYMDGGIMSYRYHQIKPQPEIYDTLIREYELKPEECVFLDDRSDNCEAARAKGMHAIVFTTREEALKGLAKLGVN
ncbi:MAG: HAD family phosphatase [Lachnospiraceae bacterium]|nr:HAD family phosphatase [Lachnospiraceae bacterium]